MKKLDPYALTAQPFALIGKQWGLVTTRAEGVTNAMTVSWGGLGVLWGKPVAYIFLRPQRYTRELLDKSALFSVGFLPERFRAQLNYCGKVSGRDEEKLAACGFTALELDGAPVLEQAELAFTCKKLYCQQLTPESFTALGMSEQNYPERDYHFLYIAEILGAYSADT